jgi:hypothetical protein
MNATEQAITYIEESKETHVGWLEFQEENPNWVEHTDPANVGDPDHHRQCIAEYEFVLRVLRGEIE